MVRNGMNREAARELAEIFPDLPAQSTSGTELAQDPYGSVARKVAKRKEVMFWQSQGIMTKHWPLVA